MTATLLLAGFAFMANRQGIRLAAESRRVRRLYEHRPVLYGRIT
ncbi:MAG: hypothetical protein U1F33_10820 [Alphaproteobacteria bacterium]